MSSDDAERRERARRTLLGPYTAADFAQDWPRTWEAVGVFRERHPDVTEVELMELLMVLRGEEGSRWRI